MNSILDTAKSIRLNVLNNTFSKDEFQDFIEKYPKFYEMLIRKDMDNDMFKKMCELLSKNDLNDQSTASEFSQYGAEKYLYPTYGTPSKKEINRAKSILKNK
jgi:hypothetical protein